MTDHVVSGAVAGGLGAGLPAADALIGPGHDVFALLAALAANGADAPVGLVVLGEADLVRLRTRRESRLALPLHGTPALREVLRWAVEDTTRLAVLDLTEPEWGDTWRDPDLHGLVSFALAPVQQGGRVVGVLGAADTLSRPWGPEELGHLSDVARLLEHDLSSRARTATAERVVRGWEAVAAGLGGAELSVGTLVRAVDEGEDPGLRARAAHVQGRLEALAEDVNHLESTLESGRALATLDAVDLRFGVTAAVRAAARSAPGVRIRPRLHAAALPAQADPAAVRSGVLALLDAVTTVPGAGEVHVRLEPVAGSPDDPAVGPVIRLVVDAPGRECDVAVLAAAVGRFEAVVRRPGHAVPAEPPALVAAGDGVVVHGRTVTARSGRGGTRLETTWGVDVG